jgi:hypothetical protein
MHIKLLLPVGADSKYVVLRDVFVVQIVRHCRLSSRMKLLLVVGLRLCLQLRSASDHEYVHP